MYNATTKTFHCNNCYKEIKSWESCWMKAQLPLKSSEAQLKFRKQLELENAPILCLDCVEKLKNKKIQ